MSYSPTPDPCLCFFFVCYVSSLPAKPWIPDQVWDWRDEVEIRLGCWRGTNWRPVCNSFIHSFTSFSKHLWGLRSGPGPGMGSEDTMNGALDTTPVLPELPVHGERQWKGIANTPRQRGQLRTLESTWHPECPVGARSCTQRFVQVLWLKFSHLSNGESPSDFFHRVVMRKERVFFVKHWE